MPVGNDVVDLQDPQSQPQALHPRWDTRVFTSAEMALLRQAQDKHRTRWQLWAAKESAFKVGRAMCATLPFYPTAFVVHELDEWGAQVRHETDLFEVELRSTADWVHAVATPAGSESADYFVDAVRVGIDGETPVADPAPALSSRFVRELACRHISGALGLTGELRLSTEAGVPVAYVGTTVIPVDVSLSHHGRFVAAAWLTRAGGAAGNVPE